MSIPVTIPTRLARHVLLAVVCLAAIVSCVASPDRTRADTSAGVVVADSTRESDTLADSATGTRDSAYVTSAAWATLPVGDERDGFVLRTDGSLAYLGRTIGYGLALRETGGGDEGKEIRYKVSPIDPTGSYAIVHGVSSAGNASRVFVARLRSGSVAETRTLRYGPADWIAYAAGTPYAIVISKQEGAGQLFRIHLPTGDSREVDLSRFGTGVNTAAADESTFAWLGTPPTAFTVRVRLSCVGPPSECPVATPSPAPARARVDLATLAVSERR